MSEIKDTIHIRVEYFSGQDEGDSGHPYYVASCEEITAITDGKTWGELMHNIEEMLAVHFEDEDTIESYGIAPNPRVVVTMELPENYAQIA